MNNNAMTADDIRTDITASIDACYTGTLYYEAMTVDDEDATVTVEMTDGVISSSHIMYDDKTYNKELTIQLVHAGSETSLLDICVSDPSIYIRVDDTSWSPEEEIALIDDENPMWQYIVDGGDPEDLIDASSYDDIRELLDDDDDYDDDYDDEKIKKDLEELQNIITDTTIYRHIYITTGPISHDEEGYVIESNPYGIFDAIDLSTIR